MEIDNFIKIHYKKILIFITLIFLVLNAFTFLSIRYVKSNNLVITKDFTIYYKLSNNIFRTVIDLINLEGFQTSLINYSNNELSLNQLENFDFIFTFSGPSSNLLQIKIVSKNRNYANYAQHLQEMKKFTIYFRKNFQKYFKEKLIAYDLLKEENAIGTEDATIKLIQILNLIIQNKDDQNNNRVKNKALDFLEEDLIPNLVEDLRDIENNRFDGLMQIVLENDNFMKPQILNDKVNKQTLSLYTIYFIIYLVIYFIIISAIFIKNKLHAKI